MSGSSGYAPESVPLAIFIANAAHSVESGIFSALACGGDTDTIASMIGHILGAQNHALPDEWKEKIPCAQAIASLCAPIE